MTTIIDGSAGITFPNSTVQASAGQVLQVIQTSFNTYLSVSSTTYTDTGITATITPKFATSKILVMVSAKLGIAYSSNDAAGNAGFTNILRGSTTIYESQRTPFGRFGTSVTGAWRYDTSNSFCVLDSPATTSSTTYKMQVKLNSTANSGEYLVNDYESSSTSTNGCTITLMEIAQ